MRKIRKAVITTAGLGTRFLPVTKAIPKSMLPVVDRPIIDYIVDEAVAAGLEEAVIVVGSNAEVVKRHFAKDAALEERLISDGKTELLAALRAVSARVKITFVTQTVMNGLAGALLCAEEAIGGEPFALLLGDEIIHAAAGETPCIRRLCDVTEKTERSVVAAMRVSEEEVCKYGNIGVAKDGDVKEVYDFIEKPSPAERLSDYAIIGRYAFTPEIFGEIRKLKMHGNEIILTEAFRSLAEKGRISAAEFAGKRYDVGDKFGYVQANAEYALRDEHIGAEMAEYLKKLKIGL